MTDNKSDSSNNQESNDSPVVTTTTSTTSTTKPIAFKPRIKQPRMVVKKFQEVKSQVKLVEKPPQKK